MKKSDSKPQKPKPSGTNASGINLMLRDWLTEGRALFLIVAATVLVYANSLSGGFVFDDTKQIVGNPALR